MAHETTNIGLRKPVPTENFDIDRDFNANWDKIDEELGNLEVGVENTYTKDEVDAKDGLKADKADTYTKTEVDGKDALKADLSEIETARGSEASLGARLASTDAQLNDKVQNFKIKNEIVNGDFSNGTAGWLSNSTNNRLSVSNNVLTSTIDVVTGPSYLRFDMPNLNKSKVYVNFMMKPFRSHEPIIRFTPNNYTIAKVMTANEFNQVSTVVDVVGGTPQPFMIYDNRNATDDMVVGSKTEYKNILIVNLTATFGAGNEPTKEGMDELMKFIPNGWWDGELSLTQKQIVDWLLKLGREKANKEQEEWQRATLLNGYTGVVKYRINNFNNLEIIGSIQSPSNIVANTNQAFVLPMDYVPNWFSPNANYADLRFKFSIATDFTETNPARAVLSGYNGLFVVTAGSNRNAFHLNISIPMRAV